MTEYRAVSKHSMNCVMCIFVSATNLIEMVIIPGGEGFDNQIC